MHSPTRGLCVAGLQPVVWTDAPALSLNEPANGLPHASASEYASELNFQRCLATWLHIQRRQD